MLSVLERIAERLELPPPSISSGNQPDRGFWKLGGEDSIFVVPISKRDDEFWDLMSRMGGEVSFYRGREDLIEKVGQAQAMILQRAHLEKKRQSGKKLLWFSVLLILTYAMAGAWLRYLDASWRLPFLSFSREMYPHYLQLHVPSQGGILLVFLALKLRKMLVKPSHLLQAGSALAVLFCLLTVLFFSWELFTYGFITKDEKIYGQVFTRIHSEGWAMLTTYEPLNFRQLIIDDVFRLYRSKGFSPNIWPFWQPWLIVLINLSSLWLVGRWFLSRVLLSGRKT